MGLKTGGKLPSGSRLERIRQSPHYTKKGFVNLSETPMKAEDASYWKMIARMIRRDKNVTPPVAIPSIKTDLKKSFSHEPFIIWFGHSSYLIRIAGKNILVDPVFSGHASPVSMMIKAFPGTDIYKAEDMPAIDYLILTHDHYDHLDYKTVRQLKDKVNRVYCSLGIGSHLTYWGFDENKIHEMDWWDTSIVDDAITLTAAPARHFSGRGLKRNQTFWSSFILKTPGYQIYLGGDSGYDTHFKEIGKKYGPFDLAILEAGQYNNMWPFIHMMPEQTVQAAIDLGAKMLLPVHWGKFTLAMHPWNEPIKRVWEKAQSSPIKLLTPKIGELVFLKENYIISKWWEL